MTRIDPNALTTDAAGRLASDTFAKVANARLAALSTGKACPDLAASVDTVEHALHQRHRVARPGRWDDQPAYRQARVARTALAEARMLAELLAAALDRAQDAVLELQAEARQLGDQPAA